MPPVVEEGRADGPVVAAGEEGEDGSVGGGWQGWEKLEWEVPGVEVDLGDADVIARVEAFGEVGVAEGSDGVGEKERV